MKNSWLASMRIWSRAEVTCRSLESVWIVWYSFTSDYDLLSVQRKWLQPGPVWRTWKRRALISVSSNALMHTYVVLLQLFFFASVWMLQCLRSRLLVCGLYTSVCACVQMVTTMSSWVQWGLFVWSPVSQTLWTSTSCPSAQAPSTALCCWFAHRSVSVCAYRNNVVSCSGSLLKSDLSRPLQEDGLNAGGQISLRNYVCDK